MMKKGQGISINMMILIVMGLIVLIIAIILITKNSKEGDRTLKGALDCPTDKGYSCVSADSCNDDKEDYRKCENPQQVCCAPLKQ
jgi:hypothetical protein